MNFLETTETPAVIESTNEWFTSKDHYLEFRAAFKNWAKRGGQLDSCHFLLYSILRNRDWNKGWTTPTNPGKLTEHHYKIANAFYAIKSPHNERYLLAPFDGTITTEMLIEIRSQLDAIRKGRFAIIKGE